MSSGVLAAGLIGIGIAVQVAILGRASTDSSPLVVSLALQIAGVAAAALWATQRGAWPDVLAVGRHWWLLPLGILGWALVGALGFAASRIGVATTLGLSIGAQLLTAVVIDAIADGPPVTPRLVGGLALVLGGGVLLASST